MRSYDLKLKRASEHVEAVKGEIDRWLGTDAYTISREVDPETGDTIRRAQIQSRPPAELSIMIGDAVHNLRSALDHAVYYLAQGGSAPLTPEAEASLAFPIVGNENRAGEPADGSVIYNRLLARGSLHGVPDAARAFIESEQPYHWDDGYGYHWLWVVNDLDRIDKHRRLAVTTAWLGVPYATVPEGVSPRITWARAEGPVNDKDVLVTYSGADEGVDAYFTRAVAINEGTAQEAEAVACLTNLQARVEWIVRALGAGR